MLILTGILKLYYTDPIESEDAFKVWYQIYNLVLARHELNPQPL